MTVAAARITPIGVFHKVKPASLQGKSETSDQVSRPALFNLTVRDRHVYLRPRP
jgi:hypothetical protein